MPGKSPPASAINWMPTKLSWPASPLFFSLFTRAIPTPSRAMPRRFQTPIRTFTCWRSHGAFHWPSRPHSKPCCKRPGDRTSRIKDFPVLAHQPRKQQPETTDTWPILFMYPALPEAKGIYGLRLETVDYLFHTLAHAKGNARPVVSPVFSMYEGGKSFILLQEVNRPEQFARGERANLFGDTMTALLLIRTDRLLSLSASGRTVPERGVDRAAE